MKSIYISLAIISLMLLLQCGGSKTDGVTIEWWQFWTDPAIRPAI